ncbi:LytS/YhcK type 5TM receptor domain-containing protein [Ammoniphilus sp. CFH 90114]|uniref:LytS/YhcK type 5TM receptor domain-containing protein n=1 Tax=Ammoniphilus sp. CFH 90114 TaxID=2493665 RepID=UPI00100EEF77|nr:LytS/YhcK type 5TM receptor domain-containing protein [Ammoniphilus sp. CFH 90114]RXT08767.1 sensor histidine kinase [Ammoniphilus sp. CFH 90114]
MEQLTLLLFERTGILLILTFILTRIPMFRQLLDREVSFRTSLYFSIIFGTFGSAGIYAGVIVTEDQLISSFWITTLELDEGLAHSALVGVVIGGLLGGPVVGVGAGLITGIHLFSLGGFTALANGLSAPITGLLAGWIARFFSHERVITASKALFIGMFAPILLMGLILIFSYPPDESIRLVNTIGIPMVLTNSVSIAIFTTMIRVALHEEERSAAFETQRALKIAELTLPYLKKGLKPETALATAHLLKKELKAAAVAVTDTEHILAHVGIGSNHHLPGEELQTELARTAIRTGEVQIAYHRNQIQCRESKCPLGASIKVPIIQAGRVTGIIALYFKRPQQITKVEEALARGLGTLISNQLNLALAENMANLMKDAELRILQAQIHPHFMFNTLNSINTLIRLDPQLARHVTVQLGTYMRLNLKMVSSQLVPIKQEMSHLQAYIEIIKIRFADQFAIHCEMEEELEEVFIPPVILQPLVENSIHHGLKGKPNGGEIRIQVKREGNQVKVVVEDNGSGIAEEVIEHIGKTSVKSQEGNGIGVYNVNQRLTSLFGPDAKLNFENREGGGCRIFFSIPYAAHREGEI